MRLHQEVSYLDPRGQRVAATITGVTGSGPTGYKTLNLAYNAGNGVEVATDVPYIEDRQDGIGYWMFPEEIQSLTVLPSSGEVEAAPEVEVPPVVPELELPPPEESVASVPQ